MICCNCGREYDPDSIIDCWVINKKGQKSHISRVKMNGQIIAFCKYCVRAVTFGVNAIAVESNIEKLSKEYGICVKE